VQPGSETITAVASAQPRKHRESVLTIWFIVPPAAASVRQARHRGNYSRSIDVDGVQDRANRRRPFAMGSMLEYDLVVIGSGPGG
jgi:hypothetical protein